MAHAPIANNEEGCGDIGERDRGGLEDAACEAKLTFLGEEIGVRGAFKNDHQCDDRHLQHRHFRVAGNIVNAAAGCLAELQLRVTRALVAFWRCSVPVLGLLTASCRKVVIAAQLAKAVKAQRGASCIVSLQDDLVQRVTRALCQIDNIFFA